MSKNKPAGKFSQRDLLLKYQKEDIKETTGLEKIREQDIEVFDMNEDTNNKVIEYNKNIMTLDSDYSSLKPTKKLVVRAFMKELVRTEKGTLIPNYIPVSKPTTSGIGSSGVVEAPPYTRKVVVVAVPEHYQGVKQGDILYLSEDTIKAFAKGNGNEATIHVKDAFIHPESNLSNIPDSISHKDYGYLLIEYHQIEFIK